MFTTIAVLASASCAAALVTGSRCIGLRKIAKHSTKADVAFTAGIGFFLAGTLTGLATAVVAGLLMAVTLSVLKTFYDLVDKAQAGCEAVKADFRERHGDVEPTTAPEGECELWVRGKFCGMMN